MAFSLVDATPVLSVFEVVNKRRGVADRVTCCVDNVGEPKRTALLLGTEELSVGRDGF